MARCPDCNKFVGYDEGYEPEASNFAVDYDGRVTGDVRVVLACSECGTELKEYNFDVDVQIKHVCQGQSDPEDLDDVEAGYETDDPEAEFLFECPTTKKVFLKRKQEWVDRPIPRRGQVNYYGAVLTGTVTCNRCGEEIEYEERILERASAFEDLT